MMPKRMRRSPLLPTTLLAVGVLITGCGSQTKTVTISSAPRPHTTSTAKTSEPSTSKTSSTQSETTAAQSTSEAASTTTRTSTAPAFVNEQEGGGERESGALHAAVETLKKQGYTPRSTAEYHPHQTLRVMIGTKSKAGEEHVQRAFFFLDDKYIGTDASTPSALLKVVSQSETEVTLSYGLYSAGNSLCCPGGGEAKVGFQLNNGRLVPLSPIPPAHARKGLSRL